MTRPSAFHRLATTTLVPAVVVAAGAALMALNAASALGHGGDANLALSRERVDPGDSLTVTGTDVAPLEEVPVQLVGPDEPLVLGIARGDEHGDFSLIVIIPADTPVGDYSIAVTTPDEALVAVPLRVGPAAPAASAETGGSPGASGAAGPGSEEPSASLDLGDGPLASEPPADSPTASIVDPTATAAPVGPGLRSLAFVILVAGSLALAAWPFLPRSRDR